MRLLHRHYPLPTLPITSSKPIRRQRNTLTPLRHRLRQQMRHCHPILPMHLVLPLSTSRHPLPLSRTLHPPLAPPPQAYPHQPTNTNLKKKSHVTSAILLLLQRYQPSPIILNLLMPPPYLLTIHQTPAPPTLSYTLFHPNWMISQWNSQLQTPAKKTWKTA